MNDQSSSNSPTFSPTPSKSPGHPSLDLSREGMLKRRSEQAIERQDAKCGLPTHKKRGRKRKHLNDDEQKEARRWQQEISHLNIAKENKGKSNSRIYYQYISMQGTFRHILACNN
jgi:hypothetical protein